MRKPIVIFSLLVLLLAVAFAGCASSSDQHEEFTTAEAGNNPNCTEHEDLNNDGICDLCGERMEMPVLEADEPDVMPEEESNSESISKPETDGTPRVTISKVDYYITTNIFVKYYVLCENTEDISGLELFIWEGAPDDLLYREGNETARLTEYKTETVDGREYFVFEYADYKYTEIATPLYARAIIGGGRLISKVNKYSILGYAYDKLGKVDPEDRTGDAALIEALEALLSFGQTMQEVLEIGLYRPLGGDWYRIKVINGKLGDGFGEGMYFVGDKVTLVAANYSGHSFSHWELNGERVGEDRQIEITVGNSHDVYTAVYDK